MHASMRPGRFHPGNEFLDRFLHLLGIASMRPGRFHPGNGRDKEDIAVLADQLQ